MDLIDYVLLKLQKCYHDRAFGNIHDVSKKQDQEIELRVSKIKEELPVILETYHFSYEKVRNFFEEKYHKDFNEKNILYVFTDKLFLNKKKAGMLELKNILPLKADHKFKDDKYQNIIDEYAEKKINHSYDAFYQIYVPVNYLTIDEMSYLSSFKILSRVGIELSVYERFAILLSLNKFEEFNFMASKFKDIDDHGMCSLLFKICDYNLRNNIDMDEFIYNWKKKSIEQHPAFFDHIEELGKSKRQTLEDFFENENKGVVFSFIKSEPRYNSSELQQVYSFIHKCTNIEEIIALKNIVKENISVESAPSRRRI